MGHKTKEFEEKFSEYIGVNHSIAVNSCTAALFLSLKVLNIKENDEVITTPFTFTATANTIVHCNAKPIFVDIDDKTYNIDASKIEDKITAKTKAIIIVHYGGQPADMKKINAISNEYEIPVIEDAAHATGSYYSNGKKVGRSNNLTCFSFYATKPMTTGEGGMITTNNKGFTDKLKILRLHGISVEAWKRYINPKASWYYDVLEAGYKFNTTDLNAALGIEQLKKLDLMNEKRKEINEYYNSELKDFDIILPNIKSDIKSSYHLYPIRLKNYDRDKFISRMAESGINTSVHFIPLHLMPYYQKTWKYRKGDFPVAEAVFKNIVSLPIYPQLNDEKLQYIVKIIKNILNGSD